MLRIVVSIYMLSAVLLGSGFSDLNTKFSNMEKGKYPVQIDTLNGFINFLKCDKVEDSKDFGFIGCAKNLNIYYLIFKDKKRFENFCTNVLKGNAKEQKSDNGWINYYVCTNSDLIATKTRVLENKRDLYVVSFNNKTAMEQDEPLLLYFLNTIANKKDKELITNF